MKNLVFCGVLLSLILSNVYGLDPSREYPNVPSDYSITFEEIKIPVEDGAELNAWYYPATSQNTSYKLIILADDGEGNQSDLIEIASNFLSQGYHVLSFDYRGFGKSSDFEIRNDFYIYTQFEKDFMAVVKYAEGLNFIRIIHIYGKKIGAGLALSVGANTRTTKIIADSPYTSFEEIGVQFEKAGLPVPKFPLGYDKTKLEPVYAMTRKDWPLLGLYIIVGSDDKVYTKKYVTPLTKFRSNCSEILVVKGATADNTFSIGKNAYFDNILKFMNSKDPNK